MVKKLTVVSWAMFLCLLYLCSCSTGSAIYEVQEKIRMNYNNISNYNDFWMTSDSLCYLDDSLVQKYFLVDKNSKTRIGTNSGHGSGKIQKYDNKIYILDESNVIDEYNSEFELKVYDVISKTTTKICSIKNCDNFLVLDEAVYYLEYNWVDGIRTMALKKSLIDFSGHNTIGTEVLSFGVIENNLFYVTEEKNMVVIFRYNDETKSSIKCGEFSLETINTKNFRDSVKVSYTSNYVLFSWVDYENKASMISKYSFKNNILNNINVEGYIDGFVAYDTYSYFICFGI